MQRDDAQSDNKQHRAVLEQSLDRANAHLARLNAKHRSAALMTGDRRYRTVRGIEEEILIATIHRDKCVRDLQNLKAPTKVSGPRIFSASEDYCSITYRGVPYILTKNQRKIIKLLHEAYIEGTPALSKGALLSAIEAETSRVRDSFKNSPLWRTLVISNGRRGTYSLNLGE